jgi:ABC-type transporter Mla maintaining outer membrane lipid asymmetry ATPase subunit MlaF
MKPMNMAAKSETPAIDVFGTSPLKKVIATQSIRVENLDVFIGDQHILKDINLTIPEKSITCVIGPSGCGKSTFLKL